MSDKAWDRVPIDAQAVDAPLSRAAVFLTVTVHENAAAMAKVCDALDGVGDLVKTVGFRDLAGRLSCIVGIGHALWDRLKIDVQQIDVQAAGAKIVRPDQGGCPQRSCDAPATSCSTSARNGPTCASSSSASSLTASATT